MAKNGLLGAHAHGDSPVISLHVALKYTFPGFLAT